MHDQCQRVPEDPLCIKETRQQIQARRQQPFPRTAAQAKPCGRSLPSVYAGRSEDGTFQLWLITRALQERPFVCLVQRRGGGEGVTRPVFPGLRVSVLLLPLELPFANRPVLKKRHTCAGLDGAEPEPPGVGPRPPPQAVPQRCVPGPQGGP